VLIISNYYKFLNIFSVQFLIRTKFKYLKMAVQCLINSIVFCEDINYQEFIKGVWDSCSYNQKEQIFKSIVYLRSPRFGSGNEENGLKAIIALMEVDRDFFLARIIKYAEYVSWKDLKKFLGYGCDNEIIQMWANQINTDLSFLKKGKVKKITYAAKYFPSEGSNLDKITKANLKACKHLKINKACFRKTYLTPLRKEINITETHICKGNYDKINYETMPRRARSKYNKIFLDKDSERYLEYLSKRDWFWIPNTYWNLKDLPNNIPTTNNLQKKDENILVMIDITPLMSLVVKKIAFSFLQEIHKRFNLYICNFSESDKIYEINSILKLISIYEKISIVEPKDFKPPENFSGSVIVLTTSYRKCKFDNYNIITWWSITHNPIFVKNIRGICYINGYSKWVYEMLVTKLIVNRNEVADLLINSVGI